MPRKSEKDMAKERIEARKREAAKIKKEKDEKLAKKKAAIMAIRLSKDHKTKLAKKLANGIIVDVINEVQARLAQEAGFTAVCIFTQPPNVPFGPGDATSRASDSRAARLLMNRVLIPVMAKVSIGHFLEAKVAERVGVNLIDESDYLDSNASVFLDKENIAPPVICGITCLKDGINRIKEGASMLRTPIQPQSGIAGTIGTLTAIFDSLELCKDEEKRKTYFTENEIPEDDSKYIKDGKFTVPLFGYGAIATPSDVALMMELGCDGVYVDNIAFASDNPRNRLKAMVQAVKHSKNMTEMLKLSVGTANRLL
ncbi:hypothetical protein GGI04_000754 [Coemansia thaxteri]|nr:hypothetical protein GGI04_000754 [Coemansia thaxteri]